MITLLRAHDSTAGHTIRAWTGPATDEGVGLIALVEVSDPTGRPLCRFDEFLDASAQHTKWPRDEHEACRLLQEQAVDRARAAVLSGMLTALHGRRFEAQ